MHAHDGGCLLGDGSFVVTRMRLVRRTHVDQCGTTDLHHFRQAERTTDFDELAARDNDFFPGGDRIQHKGRSRCVVVHDRGCLGAGELLQQPLDAGIARPAPAGLHIDLQH